MTKKSLGWLLVAGGMACGGAATHRVSLVPPPPDSSPIAALIGHEADAGIGVFYDLTDAHGRSVAALDAVPAGVYRLEVKPPCGRTAEKTVEVRGTKAIPLEIPAVDSRTLYVTRPVRAPEMRFGGNGKAVDIAADAQVEMIRPWPFKRADQSFASGQDCTGALVRLVDPKGPAGEYFIVPRSALSEEPMASPDGSEGVETGSAAGPDGDAAAENTAAAGSAGGDE